MFREDMISDGIENCVQYIHNFNPERSQNPFAYFTQIIHYAFLRRIQKEKKQLEIKNKIIERTGFDEVMMIDDNLLSGSNSEYNTMKDAIQYRNNNR
jgi:DNA-directed RNA polymerase specialized sigma24 family protein